MDEIIYSHWTILCCQNCAVYVRNIAMCRDVYGDSKMLLLLTDLLLFEKNYKIFLQMITLFSRSDTLRFLSLGLLKIKNLQNPNNQFECSTE